MEFFQPLTIIMFLLAVVVILAVVLAKERTQYFTATRLIKSMEIKEYLLRENEECLHKFALKSEGGVLWITNERVIHRHSLRFSLLFFADLDEITKVERDGNTLVLTLGEKRKQKVELYEENVEEVFNIIGTKILS